MKKALMVAAVGIAGLLAFAGCKTTDTRTRNSVDELVEKYGYQWTDTTKPILSKDPTADDPNAEPLVFNIYSSKNGNAIDYNQMQVMKDLYDSTKVDVRWTNVAESGFGDKITTKMSDHVGTDAIYHAGLSPKLIDTYGRDRHTLLAIDEYLDYMPIFKGILEKRPDLKRLITSEDGHIYSLPRVEEMGLLQNPNLLFLNKQWAAAAIDGGADVGTLTKDKLVDGVALTWSQMENILKYFAENDMNGNGKTDDERPLSFVYNNWQGNIYDLFGAFGINDNPNHLIVENGKVVCPMVEHKEDYFKAINEINKWIKAKYIDDVSFTQDQTTFLANGKGTGKDLTYGAFYWWESETVISKEEQENYIVCSPLIGPDGKQTVCVSNEPEIKTGELVIFADSPNVEVLLTYFDRFYDPIISAQVNYGPIGVVFEEEKDADGKLVVKEPEDGKTVDEVRNQNAPYGICYLSEEQWENTVNMEPRAQLRLQRLAQCVTPFVPAGVEPLPNLLFTQKELKAFEKYDSTVNKQFANLSGYLRDGITEAKWNTFISNLTGKSVRLNDLLEAYQSAYDRYKAEN